MSGLAVWKADETVTARSCYGIASAIGGLESASKNSQTEKLILHWAECHLAYDLLIAIKKVMIAEFAVFEATYLPYSRIAPPSRQEIAKFRADAASKSWRKILDQRGGIVTFFNRVRYYASRGLSEHSPEQLNGYLKSWGVSDEQNQAISDWLLTPLLERLASRFQELAADQSRKEKGESAETSATGSADAPASVPSQGKPVPPAGPHNDGIALPKGDFHSETQAERSKQEDEVKIFISHSSLDERIAEALTEFLMRALVIQGRDIRCTSVPGFKLPAGAHTSTQLRAELNQSQVVIGLLTTNSMHSSYVMFELGAGWGLGKRIIPIMGPGFNVSDLRPPLSEAHAIKSDQRSDWAQLVDELTQVLNVDRKPLAEFSRAIDRLVDIH
jgi:hypothetical protein